MFLLFVKLRSCKTIRPQSSVTVFQKDTTSFTCLDLVPHDVLEVAACASYIVATR